MTGDTIRLLGSLRNAASIADGEAVAELIISGSGAPPVTLVVRAGDHLSEAAYDEAPSPLAHRKATVGMRWEPRDPAGTVYPRDVFLADLPLPAAMAVEQIEVRALLREGSLRLAGLGVFDRATNLVWSILPSHRAKYSLAFESDTTVVFENQAALPRAFLAARGVTVTPDDWALVSLTDTPFDPRTTVLLERPAESARPELELGGAPIGPGERAEIVEYTPDGVTVWVRADEARYLVLTDSYFPGWQARIDGAPVEIERADYLFRAVRVPAGEHTVEWRYQPTSLMVGATISAIGLAATIALAMCGLVRAPAVLATRRPVVRGWTDRPLPA
jgi:hypothetical protein